MPKVTYRGPSHRLEIDGLILDRDGSAVELTEEQMQRAGAEEMFSEEGSEVVYTVHPEHPVAEEGESE